jgi:hypothetical protein
MKKLTKAQQETVNKVTENYINSNEPLLFDKEHAIKMGEQFKKELQELTLFNMTIKEQRRLQATKDYEYLCNFFEPYDELIEFKTYDEEYVITIGHNTKLKMFLTYKFRSDDWSVGDNICIANEKHENYMNISYIDVYSDNIGDYHEYETLLDIFKDEEYTSTCEKIIMDHIKNN